MRLIQAGKSYRIDPENPIVVTVLEMRGRGRNRQVLYARDDRPQERPGWQRLKWFRMRVIEEAER